MAVLVACMVVELVVVDCMVFALAVVAYMALVALVVVACMVPGLVDMASEVLEVCMELEYCYWNNLGLVSVAWHCMVVVPVMEYIQHDLVEIHHHRREMPSFLS